MKLCLNAPRFLAALAVAPVLTGTLIQQVSAQDATLVDWNHSWNYMFPTAGVLPAGSGATEPNSGPTKWYADQAAFDASYAGPSFTTAGTDFDAGSGPGPVGYGVLDYFTAVGAEFGGLGTTLTLPAGNRYTGYLRTTFNVPAGGTFYVNPVLRFILDDGGFVYLDGELVLTVNMGLAADTYTAVAAGTTSTENPLRFADLSLPVGSATGGNSLVAPAIASNSIVRKRITSLSAGVHTLAVSAHQQATNSSDLDLALQLKATATTAAIAGTLTSVSRSPGLLPLDPSDDLVGFKLNVASTGAVSPTGWTISAPASIGGTTGAYNTDVTVSVPIGAFGTDPTTTPTVPVPLTITINDTNTPGITTSATVLPPRVMGIDDHTGVNVPILTTAAIPTAGWIFNDTTRTLAMNNGGGGGRKVITSEVIDLSSAPAVQFTGVLDIHDASTGTEATDSFVAYLIIDGNTAAPVNLITPYDTIIPDGVLTDDELAPTGATSPAPAVADFTKNLSAIIPASANSVQIVIEGINDSDHEFLTVHDLKISTAPASLMVTKGAVTVNNRGTDDPLDDTFGAPLTIAAVNLGASPGWTGTTTPSTGLYTDPQPVLFQNFSLAGGPVSFTLTDIGNVTVNSAVTLTPTAPALTVAAPTNIVRNENGPGPGDDTVTFDTIITGSDGGPRWSTTSPVNPSSGPFGAVTFTIPAPVPGAPLSMVIADISYPAVSQTIPVAFPVRYTIGLTDFGGTQTAFGTPLGVTPSTVFINDAALRTLEVNNAGTPEKVIESDLIDLSAIGALQFTGKLRAADTSVGSNFETEDKVKVELIYETGGVPTTINLITAWDVGDGASALTGTGANGPPDGYLNGYTGAAGTDAGNGTVYATLLANYDANLVRDELNKSAQTGETAVDATFDLSATIPADADNVKLKLSIVSLGGSERAILSDLLFTSTTGPVDSDSDGMTDAYEDANGLNKLDASDKFTDLDNDGQSNFAEFLAGTSANNPASTFKLTTILPTATANIYSVSIATVAGKRYQLQESSDLGGSDVWADLPGVVTATGAATTVQVNISGLGTHHFLRAKVVP